MKLFLLYWISLLTTSLYAQPATNLTLAQTYNNQAPTAFEKNNGQILDTEGEVAASVQYHYQNKGMNVYLLPTGLAYQLTKIHSPKGALEKQKTKAEQIAWEEETRVETYRIDMTLVGANPHPTIISTGKSQDYTHYYNRNALEVYSYEQVTYQDVYPGIDWVIYTTEEGLKYDFVVHVGANPEQIQLAFTHHKDIHLNKDGSLTILSSMGQLTEKAPVSFQGDQKVKTSFQLEGNQLRFELDYYDKSQDLIIDPSVVWGTYYGDIGPDFGLSCSLDGMGNIYLAGYVNQSSMNIASGGHQNTLGGRVDAFLAKFDSNGVRQWATYYGGAQYDFGVDCKVDRNNNVYLVGHTRSFTGIASGGHQNSLGGSMGFQDAFLVKFNSSGVRQWGTYYGGANTDRGLGCSLDASGNIYLTGQTASTTGIASGGQQNSLAGDFDAFLVKFTSNGVRQWATYCGGTGREYGYSCSVNNNGNVYLAGQTTSPAGIAVGGHQNSLGGNEDAFLVKYNSSGLRQWGTYYGGTNIEYSYGCQTDGLGHVYLVGESYSANNIASGGYQDSLNGVSDVFIAKFNNNGVRQWGTYYGGPGEERKSNCAIGQGGAIYITGETFSTTGIATGGQGSSNAGIYDAFLVKFDSNAQLQWGRYYGGAATDYGHACVVDTTRGQIYIAGMTQSTNGIGTGGHQNTLGGNSDAFLACFSEQCVVNFSTFSDTACGSYTYNGQLYTQSGMYQDTLTNEGGCDSIVSIALVINQPTTSVDSITACNTYTWIDGNTYISNNNIATVTLTNVMGCDSVITLNLTIDTVDTNISLTGLTLSAAATGVAYQWLDCNNNLAAIATETNQQFTPAQNGDYAVVITQNGCLDTSACVSVTVIAVAQLASGPTILLYPNPTTGNISIDIGKLQQASLTIYSMDGKLIQQYKHLKGQLQHVVLPEDTGMYLLEVVTPKGVGHYKVMKVQN
ncbi:MAG: SBBP repeat-containing protein [Aureispira sp.]